LSRAWVCSKVAPSSPELHKCSGLDNKNRNRDWWRIGNRSGNLHDFRSEWRPRFFVFEIRDLEAAESGPSDKFARMVALQTRSDATSTDAGASRVRGVHQFSTMRAPRLDILVNKRGHRSRRHRREHQRKPIWDRIYSVNVKGIFLCSKAGVPRMARFRRRCNPQPRIDRLLSSGLTDRFAYSMSKGAVHSRWTRSKSPSTM